MEYAKVKRCDNGHIDTNYEDRLWRFKFQHCNTCDDGGRVGKFVILSIGVVSSDEHSAIEAP